MSEAMDKNRFWQSIEGIKKKAGYDLDAFYDLLLEHLQQLSAEEIFKWHQIFDEYQQLSYKKKLWAAAYIINDGCSDDSFDYFRAWLTAQGRKVFLAALEDPDSLADHGDAREEVACFEEIMSAGCVAYFHKLGMKERDYDLYYSQLEQRPLTEAEKAEIAGEIVYDEEIDIEWDEDDLESLVPRLCEIFR